jgi:hypothetical protein
MNDVRPEGASDDPKDLLKQLFDLAKRQQEQLDRIERSLKSSRKKETYTVKEAAEELNRRWWTVRQWCNMGQVQGAKKVHGKGRTGEWRIPHDELVRLQNEGPLPPGTVDPHGPARRKAV